LLRGINNVAKRVRTAGSTPAPALSHLDAKGKARMVDVGDKAVTAREATACGEITMSATALRLIRQGALAKGDPLQAARLAGIMAAKRTSELIRRGYRIEARVRTTSQTGVEMEALTAVAIAALTIYDMVKAVDKEMVIGDICLIEKKGGRSGHYRRRNAGA
jgi:cyclic pyranopterin monophosphate synthase